ncbi:uncharacterized protein LOC131682838 [Topomyia yanbarensis]|uniref:uncharacterized protein LOC131682838 n=1 Tax=Topomyia yanbarensis TaxID=2498891 RepID=UPI00273BA566|nr:uncharacterized protein LOC131682838 [Topomyia yanbarensis]
MHLFEKCPHLSQLNDPKIDSGNCRISIGLPTQEQQSFPKLLKFGEFLFHTDDNRFFIYINTFPYYIKPSDNNGTFQSSLSRVKLVNEKIFLQCVKMVRKRVNASKKRVLQVSNERNSEFILNDLSELKKSTRSGELSCEPDTKKLALVEIIDNNAQSESATSENHGFTKPRSIRKLAPIVKVPQQPITGKIEPEEAPQAGPSRSRDSKVGRVIADDFEDNSGDSDIENDLYGFDDDELEATEFGLTSCQEKIVDSECLAEEMAKLKAENAELRKHNMFLKKRKSNLERSHAAMQQALLSKLLPVTHKPFENIEVFPGCPSADKISKMSVVAKDSDYIFVKLLTYAIWPEGFAGRSVTGRTSNNPKGRHKKNLQSIADGQSKAENSTVPVRTALEKNKVKFVNDCLIERRLLLHDNALKAREVASKCNRLMQTVISNFNRYNSS